MTTRQLLDQFAEVAGAKRVATVKRALVGSNVTEAYVSAAEMDRVHLLAVQVTLRKHQVVHLLSAGKTTLLVTILGNLICVHVVWEKRQVGEATHPSLHLSKLSTEAGRHPSWRTCKPCSTLQPAECKQVVSDLTSGPKK